ncbi:MAG: hypothetical protein ACYTHJ_08305 [Planctomycetota bacterium]|jgi:hypothetical protein
MIRESSAFKRTYDAIALFAVLNLVTLAGASAYLIGTGVVTGDRIRGMVEYFRTVDTVEPVVAKTPEESTETEDQEIRSLDVLAGLPSNMTTEIMRREADRVKTELDQRLALNNGILLRITQERESFRRERDLEAAKKLADKEQQESFGFEKQVEIIGSLTPKVAVNHLLSMSDLDDAAKVLGLLDTRKAKRIVEAAKSPEQLEKMRSILQKLKEVAPEQKDELVRQ